MYNNNITINYEKNTNINIVLIRYLLILLLYCIFCTHLFIFYTVLQWPNTYTALQISEKKKRLNCNETDHFNTTIYDEFTNISSVYL